ncbi:hypothetical protein [Stratiformator vulcanicus]|uniref:DUF3299 domain-containing protein n=1 Tax=Stratiformator vulcanicus TaxID=2527980 RepID=A0A517QZN0_9PLAN|nr:hypothetical protein [Stratiformator vulcanicus]QDT37105.1 hypothetical protein Pan189_14730 [Stratiformator vulcanicus]
MSQQPIGDSDSAVEIAEESGSAIFSEPRPLGDTVVDSEPSTPQQTVLAEKPEIIPVAAEIPVTPQPQLQPDSGTTPDPETLAPEIETPFEPPAPPTFRREGRERALRVTYDDIDLLKLLGVDPVPPDIVSRFPDWLQELDGETVRIRGFMYPAYEERLSAFTMARDNEICCFGRNPKIYDLIVVKLLEGTTTQYIANRPFDVIGTFRIKPVHQNGNWYQIYRLEDAKVINR